MSSDSETSVLSAKTDLVILNRYAPFYRDSIFAKLNQWRRIVVLFSGHKLGGLSSVTSVDTVAVPTMFLSRMRIVWLCASLQLIKIRPKIVCT